MVTAAAPAGPPDGPACIAAGEKLFQQGQYDAAALEFWKAVLVHDQNPDQYDVQQVFQQFMQCYVVQNKLADGFAFVALESFRRGQNDMGREYLKQCLAVDPDNEAAAHIQEQFASVIDMDDKLDGILKKKKRKKRSSAAGSDDDDDDEDYDTKKKKKDDAKDELYGKTAEELYEMASEKFVAKQYEDCADMFEISCERSAYQLGPSCANAVYCRNMIMDWGFNGTQFTADMNRIADLTWQETKQWRFSAAATSNDNDDNDDNDDDDDDKSASSTFAWHRATSVHPHMMLGYPLPGNAKNASMLKRYCTESVAYMDEKMARAGQAKNNIIPPLPAGLPYDREEDRQRFLKEFEVVETTTTTTTAEDDDDDDEEEKTKTIGSMEENGEEEEITTTNDDDGSGGIAASSTTRPPPRIRVGFVGSGFNSKAVLYLSQDMFRFFDRSKFEIHVFSFGAADSPLFIQHGMRGVDWRKRVQSNVEYFWDCEAMKLDHVKAAKFIHDKNIHILIEWDGYARQGDRAQGLFALRPAPIQILHQEYLGTSGALYVDYLFSDAVTSPVQHAADLYTEKIIYMPNHFFSKGHAMQSEVKRPQYKYAAKRVPYKLGTGSPAENRCLAPATAGPAKPAIVYCNFNKFLKNNPDTVRSWIRILREVPDSMLCLLENPDSGTVYLRKFVHEAAGSSDADSDPYTFVEGADGNSINDRIHFLHWERNPFDHQMRNGDFCNVMLDSFPYNGHTVAQDALYAGVPIVTRSDGLDMCSRVTTSANTVLGLQSLNAVSGAEQYENIAIELGNNKTLLKQIRKKLIASCLQRNPMHPYWDVPRYVKNFQVGLQTAWERFIQGKPPDHIVITEPAAAAAGTYDDEIAAHPPERE